MKKTLAFLLTLILTFSCFSILGVGAVLAEGTQPSLTENETFEGFEDYAVGAKVYDHTKTGTQDMYTYGANTKLLTSFGTLEVVGKSYAHTGSKALKGSTFYQYAALPLNLKPNTEYELSFWYTYTTSDPDRYLSEISYGIYSPVTGTSFANSLAPGRGMRDDTKVFAPEEAIANTWRKATLKFTTGNDTSNIVFAYTYYDKLRSNISAVVNKCPLYIDDISVRYVENAPKKAEIDIDTKDSASVEIISGYFKDFAVGDNVQFKVRTQNALTPAVKVNGTAVEPTSKGVYSFTATESNVISVVCDGDENRQNPNVDKQGRPLYEYNREIASTPVWEGDTVYHETVLFVPGRETAKLLYPIDKVISVRSYDLATNYLEGVDYEITSDGALKILPNSKISVFKKPLETSNANGFPVYDKYNTYAEFINDYDYPAYAIAVTYEHTKVWEDGYTPSKIDSVANAIPNVFKKLQNGEEVNIVIFGDSASCGSSTSGQNYDNAIYNQSGKLVSNILNFAPYTPAWPVMLEQNLKTLYPDAKITVKNLALGGITAEWGKGAIKQRLGYLERDAGWKKTTPDLMILAYGANDLTSGHTAERFANNMQAIIDNFRSYTGSDTEVLLWSEYVANNSVVQFQTENFEEYREKYYSLAKNNKGVGLVDTVSVFFEVLESKEIYDIFNDNMVHGNDFLTRIIAQCLVAGFAEPAVLVGDIDGLYGVTDSDAEYLLMHTFFPEDYPVNQTCDFNGDGKVNDADAERLLMYTFFPEDYPLK